MTNASVGPLVYDRCMRWLYGLILSFLLCAIPHAACTQTFYGVSGGLGFAGPSPASPGFLAQASIGHLNPGDGWRLDAYAAGAFEITQTRIVYVAVMPIMCMRNVPNCGFGTTSTTASVGVAGLTLSDVLPFHRSTDGAVTYALVGAEMDRLTGGQGAPNNLLLGLSPGVGFALTPDGRRRTFVEARFHGLVDSAGLPSWALLVSVGLQWSLTKS